jgi:hypothetical protein
MLANSACAVCIVILCLNDCISCVFCMFYTAILCAIFLKTNFNDYEMLCYSTFKAGIRNAYINNLVYCMLRI